MLVYKLKLIFVPVTTLDCFSAGEGIGPYCQWNVEAPDNWKFLGYNASNKRHIQWNGAEHGPTIYGKRHC